METYINRKGIVTMNDNFRRKVLAFGLVMLGILLSYYGYLIPAVLAGTFGVIVGVAENVKFIGDEEEPNEEGEL